ncbi:hypothetical protein QWJ34_26880 [Saccharibacillus sp. CPCC 101409]|uniref:hypothetical protein n=1 Tax=Saccharibacillus sp. CPCC 101409 TaxID=3058041 RepID=UPI0026722F85|nr:hypothetical protein [Saccharibacillus sp. CPCC 101409]MDO3413403.1 hypothetical protein [Saccharibacillus sp. CPCC 101409]
MIIKKIAIGNTKEAFVEDRLTSSVNIIYSDDNNKGKTVLFQGLMYALGNEPIFPSGFNYKDYYFYTMIEIDKVEYEFLRKNNNFMLISESIFQIFDSQTELKYFLNENLFTLPTIEKSERLKMVDLQLFYQLFFVGQDKRNPSNVISSGYYNKNDFINMLCSYNGYPITNSSIEQIKDNKNLIKEKEISIKKYKKLIKISKESPLLNEFINEYADRETYSETRKSMVSLREKITEFKKKRNRETNRVIKLRNLRSELGSFNHQVDVGKVICAECGSEKILYVNSNLSFDVSNLEVRSQILHSIERSILMKSNLINEYEDNINREQQSLKKLLNETPVEIQDILIYSDEILSSEEYSREIFRLQKEIEGLKNTIGNSETTEEDTKEKKKNMLEELISLMNRHYKSIEDIAYNKYESLFTKREETYSGSDEQEFYYCKTMAINDYFNHEFPIIIDSFRDGEISTGKEQKMLEGYKKLNKQVLLSSTLKKEEYEKEKYQNLDGVNAIDYSDYANSKLLRVEDKEKFVDLLYRFGISI